MTAVRLVIAGYGLIGKRHLDAINQVSRAQAVALVDTNETAQDCPDDLPFYSSLAEALQETRPDGVILATPTPLHAEQGMECISRGYPLLVEKPLATSATEARIIVEQLKKKPVPVLVGHYRRYNPIIQKAQEIIRNGELGTLRAVHASCWLYKPDSYFAAAPWRTREGAGPVSVNLVHDIDMLRSLCGEVVCVQAQVVPSLRGFENEDLAAAILRFDNDVIATISVSDSAVSPWSWELTAHENPVYPPTSQSCCYLVGSKAALSLPHLTLWKHQGQPDWWRPISATTVPRTYEDPLVKQITHFCDVIVGKSEPLVSAEDGMKNIEIIEAIQQAAKTGETCAIEKADSVVERLH